MMKIAQGMLLCFVVITTAAQTPADNRRQIWEARIKLPAGKVKGEFYAVSDSSITILGVDRMYDEIFFRDIVNIRLMRYVRRGTKRALGFLFGAPIGSVGGVAYMTRNNPFSPLTGIFGGIIGGITGGLIGFFMAPVIHKLYASKTFVVVPGSYVELANAIQEHVY